jgi:hypothetical protein
MANIQFGFRATAPTSPVAKGISMSFAMPTGITNIASTSPDKWCTAGNLLAWNSDTSKWVECSITYFASGGSQPQGWYFWKGWSGNPNGTYTSISAPSGTQTLKLLLAPTNKWMASLNGSGSEIVGATNFDIVTGLMMFENGGNVTCSNYSPFGGLTFINLKYYDSNNQQITFTSTISVWRSSQQPNQCPGPTSCINLNTSTLTASRNC